jgi:hypothetical protein
MNWRLFLVLWLAGAVAALPLIPVTVVLGDAGLTAHPVGWWEAAVAVLLAAVVIPPLAITVGLRMGARLGLGAPLIEAWLAGRAVAGGARRLGTAAAAGGGLGLAAVVAALALAGDAAQPAAPLEEIVLWWVGLAQALSAAVDEELIFRFGLMSLIAWFAGRLMRSGDEAPSDFTMWVALGLAALIFTAVHAAPAGDAAGAAALVAEPMRLVRLLAGGLFGWLFWKHGLEAAVIAHLVYNTVLFYGIVVAL